MMTAEFMLSKRPVLRFTAALFFLLKKLEILKLVDVYKLEFAKFMHKLFNNTVNYQNCGNKILLKLNKFTPTKLGGLTNPIIFSLVFPKLLVNINSNIEELNYGTI